MFGAIRRAGREIGNIGAMLRAAEQMQSYNGKPPYFVLPDRSRPMVDVVLEPGADQLLQASGEPVPVSLEPVGPVSDGPAGIRVYVGTRPTGTLRPPDAALYRLALEAAERRDQTLMLMGVVTEAPPAGRCGCGSTRPVRPDR